MPETGKSSLAPSLDAKEQTGESLEYLIKTFAFFAEQKSQRVTDPLDDSDMEYVPEISCFVATRKFLLLGSIVMGQEF